MSASAASLSTKAIDDDLPAITLKALRYHTVDGVAHDDGAEYTITTTAGVMSTLIACQFADVVALPTVTVPDVVGMTQAAATAAMTGASLVVGTVTTASHATIPAGSVISQAPTAGTQAAAGSAVDLVVSTGP